MMITEGWRHAARSLKDVILYLSSLYCSTQRKCGWVAGVDTFPPEGCYDATGVLLRKGA